MHKVIELDFGGEISLTCPGNLIGENANLEELAIFLNKVNWGTESLEGVSIKDITTPQEIVGISGGMGGGVCIPDGLWLNDSHIRRATDRGVSKHLQEILRLADYQGKKIILRVEEDFEEYTYPELTLV